MASQEPQPRPILGPYCDGDGVPVVPIKLPGSDGKVDPISEVGKGGGGWVYAVQGRDDLVVKIWHFGREPTDADAKIRHMLENPVQHDRSAVWRVVWPLQPVKHDGVTVGYTMHRLNAGEWTQPISYYNPAVARNTERRQGREIRTDNQQRTAFRLALAFKAIHDAGYAIGDVNPKNFEINRTDEIAILDCDSFGFTTSYGKTFSDNLGMAEFQAPEQQGRQTNRTPYSDCFGLAVLIFLLFNNGNHPYNGTDPQYSELGHRIANWRFPRSASNNATTTEAQDRAWNALSSDLQLLFSRCFDRDHCERQGRPTVDEWVAALSPNPSADPAPSSPRPTPWRRRWLIALAVLIPLLAAGIWMITGGAGSGGSAAAQPAPAAAPAVVPTPTAVPPPKPTAAPVPTNPPAPTSTPYIIVVTAPAPVSANSLAPIATPLPTSTLIPPPTATPSPPTATPPPTAAPRPAATRAPAEWLIQHPAHPKIVNSSAGTQVLLQGCYLGNLTSARKFRLASWDVWDRTRYGNELMFVKILTNTGSYLPLEYGACYEATVIKQVDTTEEYVCLDADSEYPQQYPCENFREHEVIPTFLLHPDTPDNPNDFTDNFVGIPAHP